MSPDSVLFLDQHEVEILGQMYSKLTLWLGRLGGLFRLCAPEEAINCFQLCMLQSQAFLVLSVCQQAGLLVLQNATVSSIKLSASIRTFKLT